MKKTKKLLIAVVTVIAVLSLSIGFVMGATDEGVEGYYTYTKFNSKVTITDVDTSISGDVVVPSVIDGCDVITIAANAFEGCDKVTSITVPDSVTTINNAAFKGMTALESVTVPFTGKTANESGYTSTFGYVFGYSTSVASGTTHQISGYYYYIPSSVIDVTVTSDTSVPAYAFYNCNKIEKITLTSATSVGDYAFRYCSSLKSVNIDNVVTVGKYAFECCSSLTELPIPAGLKTIGAFAYSGISSFTELIIPDSVTSIGCGAFFGMNNLTSVTVPFVGNTPDSTGYSSVFGYIFDYTTTSGTSGTTQQYYDSSKTYYYYIPTSIKNIKITTDKSIPDYAFYNCANVTNVTLDKAESIGSYSFVGCEKILDIVFPNTLKTINSYAYNNCSNLKSVTFSEGLEVINSYAFANCTSLEEIDLPSSLNELHSYAFMNCSAVTELEIPNTKVHIAALKGMNSLESLTLNHIGTFTLGKFFDTNNQNSGLANSINQGSYYYVIPKSLKTVTLKRDSSVCDYAFQNCSFLTEINLPNTITSIGINSFENCSGITQINLSDSIKTINQYAFKGCTNLNDLDLPDSLEKLSYYAFTNCKALNEITMPDTLKSIGTYAFYGCSGVENIRFSNNLETIGEYAFSGCTSVTELNLPSSLKELKSYAFENCSSVKTLEIPDQTTVYQAALKGMNSLESLIVNTVTEFTLGKYFYDNATNSKITDAINQGSYYYVIPKSLKTVTVKWGSTVCDYAFQNCSFITEINLPDTITSIGQYAFENCSGITQINLSDSIKTINQYTFNGCTNLNDLDLPDSLEKISYYAFTNCKALNEITMPDTLKCIGTYAFYGCSGLETIRFSNNLETIGEYAFSGCTSVTELNLPSSLKELNKYAFENCSSVKTLEIPDRTSVYQAALKGMNSLESLTLYHIGTFTLGKYFYDNATNSKITDATNQGSYYYVIPKSLKTVTVKRGSSVCDYAFQNCSFITEINLPDTITSIGQYAFENCSGITELNLSDAIASIGQYAFANCSNIKEFDIPDLVTVINSYSFSGCTNLNKLDLPDSLETISYYAFTNCKALNEIIMPDTLKSIGTYAFSGCSGIEAVRFSNTLETIGESAFYGCTSIKELNLPSSLKELNKYAFENCSSVKTLEIPNKTTVYLAALKGMNSLESLTVNVVKEFTLGKYFYDNATNSKITDAIHQGSYYYVIPKSLKTVTVKGGTTVCDYAFQNCSFLTEINLPDTITSIGRYAFENCSGISELHFFNNVTSVGSGAFTGCSNLTVFGHSGTALETHCNSNNIPFVAFENIKSIYVSTVPTATQYVGRAVDATGIKIMAILANGTEIELTDGFSVENKVWSASGNQKFTVTYGELTTECSVNVIGVRRISLLSEPIKTSYLAGDTLDCDGLSLQIVYADATNYVTSVGFTTDLINLDEPGEQIVTVTYYGKNVYFIVNVNPVAIVKVEIEKIPDVVEYFEQDEIDTTGLVLKLTYSNGKTETVTDGFTVLTTLDNESITSVVLDYKGFKLSYAVTVKDVYVEDWWVETEPDKLEYYVGETLDTTGLIITEYYCNGKTVTVSEGFTCTPNEFTKTGRQIITVTYMDSTAMFIVNVKAACTHDNAEWNYVSNNTFEKLCPDCGKVAETKDVYLTLTADSSEVVNKQSLTLVSAVTDNFTDNITFSSSDESIATVNSEGVVTAFSVGNVTITATVEGTDITAEFSLTVVPRKFTVTWIVDGDETVVKFNEGEVITKPSTPVKVGYYFKGWDKTVPSVMPAENLTFTAQWELVSGAEDEIVNGTIGDNITWTLNLTTGVLFVEGTGDLGGEKSPWNNYRSSITEAYISNGITSIGDNTFEECSRLKKIDIPDSVTVIGNEAFACCQNITSIIIPDNVTTIGESAFYECSKLESVTIGKGVTSIGEHAFANCRKLSFIAVDKANPSFINDEYGVLYNKNMTALVQFPNGSSLTSYTIPDGVTEIKFAAFAFTKNIQELIISDSVTTIDQYAFMGCTNLVSVDFSDNLESIGQYAFIGCTNLESVYLGNKLKTIEEAAFYTCSNLKNVYLGESIEKISNEAFTGCENLETITIPVSLKTVCSSAFEGCYSLNDVFYGGNETEWKSIDIEYGNDYLIYAIIHFYENSEDFKAVNGAVIDTKTNVIYGLDAGITSLDDYTNAASKGYSWEYIETKNGFGTGTKAILKNGDVTVSEYTVLIFGDVNGDGWYDGEDAFLVNLIAKGILTRDDVDEAIWSAADCNHDDIIDEWDVDLLSCAGLKLNNVDQSATTAELALTADYIEYVMLIDQSAGFEAESDKDDTEQDSSLPETDVTVDSDGSAEESGFIIFISKILSFISKIFDWVFSFSFN